MFGDLTIRAVKLKLFITCVAIFSFLFGASRADSSSESRQDRLHRQTKDRQTIEALQNARSNLSKPHMIEHHFVTNDRAKAEALSKAGKAAGYKASAIKSLKDDNGKNYYFFDLIKPTIPKETTIFSASLRMTTLGREHGVLYDGWGCAVER